MAYADPEKQKAYFKNYGDIHRDKRTAQSKARYQLKKENQAFRDRKNARQRAASHRRRQDPMYLERERAKQRAAYPAKYADPNVKVRQSVSTRLRKVLKGERKSANTLTLLGCSIEFFREHLEKQFLTGMTWENYGATWHIDHILPCAEFHLQHSEEQEICFHWTNQQPLFATDNLSKSDKLL